VKEGVKAAAGKGGARKKIALLWEAAGGGAFIIEDTNIGRN